MTKYKKYEITIFHTALNAGIPEDLAHLILAQAKHETANFTSKVFKKNKNAFGYKYVKGAKWQMLQSGRTSPEGNQYAQYINLESSTLEITSWIYRRLKEKKFPDLETIKTPEQYAISLRKTNYYTDSITNYTRGLRKFLTKKQQQ